MKRIAGAAVLVLLTVLGTVVVQKYLVLSDDVARGERYAAAFSPDPAAESDRMSQLADACQAAAELFYGHPILEGQTDFAPRDEKAFYVGCTGLSLWGIGDSRSSGD
jgi:hypothetical protein